MNDHKEANRTAALNRTLTDAEDGEVLHMNTFNIKPQRPITKPPPMELGIMATHLTNLNFSFAGEKDKNTSESQGRKPGVK